MFQLTAALKPLASKPAIVDSRPSSILEESVVEILGM